MAAAEYFASFGPKAGPPPPFPFPEQVNSPSPRRPARDAQRPSSNNQSRPPYASGALPSSSSSSPTHLTPYNSALPPRPHSAQGSNAGARASQQQLALRPGSNNDNYRGSHSRPPSRAHSDYPAPGRGRRRTSSFSSGSSRRSSSRSRSRSLDRSRGGDRGFGRRRDSFKDDDELSRGRSHGGDKERGLLASVVGGGAGGFIGHKITGGKLGTVVGTVVGAVVANKIEHKLHNKHNHSHKPSGHGHGHGHGHGYSHSQQYLAPPPQYGYGGGYHHQQQYLPPPPPGPYRDGKHGGSHSSMNLLAPVAGGLAGALLGGRKRSNSQGGGQGSHSSHHHSRW